MKICLFLFCCLFGFWCGHTSKLLKKSKFIILVGLLCLIVSRETFASEVYQCNTDYTIYIPTIDDYQTATMPPITFYPDIIYSHRVNTNFTCGNATYQFGQDISTTHEGIETNIYETKISGGNNAGQIVGYTQEFKFVSDSADTWESTFSFDSKRGCTGTVTLYGYLNNSWVEVESTNFTTYINYDKIIPDSKINGWKYVVHCTLNSNFTFLRYDNMYDDGYLLNTFRWSIRSSQQQAEDVQNQIEENTRQTNGLLGTIKNAIDNVITTVTGIPQAIADKLTYLFVPTNPYDTLESGVEDIIDSLGVLGYPLDFYVKTMQICRDVDTQSMPVEIPAVYYEGHTIFPRYYRSDIFYFRDMPVFTNVQKTTWMKQLLGTVGIDMNTVTIGQFVKKIMNIVLFFGLVRFFAFIFDCIFGTDVEEVVDDDN